MPHWADSVIESPCLDVCLSAPSDAFSLNQPHWANSVIELPIHLFFFVCAIRCIFKALALWANAFYKSICPYVCVSVHFGGTV